jgi:class 3 adenylate cyclase
MPENLEKQIIQIQQTITALEAQRGILPDEVVDASIAALQEKVTLLKAKAEPPEQQRKLVTLLFMDTVGSTRLFGELDPEETRDIQDAALKRLAIPVEERGGHVTRFMGDGFKAIFGMPMAKENDPEVAVRAGLDILEVAREISQELKIQKGIDGFQVRIGINTGLVAIGGQTEASDTIMGAPVNLAARLESAAPPGGLLISHNTYQHIAGLFDVEPLTPVTAK